MERELRAERTSAGRVSAEARIWHWDYSLLHSTTFTHSFSRVLQLLA